MPTEISMNQRQHGKTLTLSFTIANKANDHEPTTTEPINVNDLAFVQFKFNHVLKEVYTLESSVKFKAAKADHSQVKIKITTNYETLIDTEWICGDDWAEIQLSPKRRNFCLDDAAVSNLEVNITALEVQPRRLQLSKLYDDTELTDFQLSAADGNVGIHKTLLAMHSDVFMKMFQRESKESLQSEIAIQGVTKQTLQDLKQYIYLGSLPDEGLEPLLVIAARYMMDGLQADCITKMVKMVTAEELEDLIEFACLKNLPDLMKAILTETPDTILNNLCKLRKGPLFKEEKN